jgi:hypothetical protein
MALFRTVTPKRRNITKAVTSHRGHKADLKLDFVDKCGWCDASDSWKTTYFEVDHFIPENILTIKTNTDYSNLIYSCRSCNNAKRKKWPTNDENIPNKNDEGFIDPCDDEYLKQFERNDNGEISYKTELGKWMYFALKLDKPQHQVIWQLEKLEPIVTQIKQIKDLVNIPEEIKDRIISVLVRYDNYRDALRVY